MARDKSRGIKKATGGGRAAAAAGLKKTKVNLPNIFFLSDPKAVALVNGEDQPVLEGGWVSKHGSDCFIYWYVKINGKWTAKSGAAAPKMGTIFPKDIGKLWKMHTPAWAYEVPNHFV